MVPGNDEWVWGWDPTPAIVSVWADDQGRAIVWRRPNGGALLRETVRFRPWLLLDTLDDIEASGAPFVIAPGRTAPEDAFDAKALDANVFESTPNGPTSNTPLAAPLSARQLRGPGRLQWLVSADRWSTIESALCTGASRRTGRRITRLHDLDRTGPHVLPPDEQYLVASGRTYFRDLAFDQLHRLQFDLETTGLDPNTDQVFLIAVRAPNGTVELLEADGHDAAAETRLLRRFMRTIRAHDPDVLENHNLHGFDLPFLQRRAERLGVPLILGRLAGVPLRERAASRGAPSARDPDRRIRYVVAGRECIDTLDAVRRYDFAIRELPGHGLKAVARHFGIASPTRELIPGDQVHAVYRQDPDRVRRYAQADVVEVAALARLLGGAAFALARMAPRRYERLADAGAATGVIDPLLVRAYLRAGEALPAFAPGDGTSHSGAALLLFTAGVASRIVKVDVASLYPSLMRAWHIGPARDHLGALLFLVDRLVDQRLAAKQRARMATTADERHLNEAMSAAMKLVVNSAYGYLAAGDGLTRSADVHAANEVTRRGRDTLMQMCRALADRGGLLIEADTDGIYFAVPPQWTEADERRMVDEVAALLPPLVKLEFEGRYAAMLSHEAKNYALLTDDGRLIFKGVAFRSSRAEPFGEAFLRAAIRRLLTGDIVGVRQVYLETQAALRQGVLPTAQVAAQVRLRKSPADYERTRHRRRELVYEAMRQSHQTSWRIGQRVRVYRTPDGGRVLDMVEDDVERTPDPRDYDRAYYAALLRRTYAARLARAFHPQDFAHLFADTEQLPLFDARLEEIKPIASRIDEAWRTMEGG